MKYWLVTWEAIGDHIVIDNEIATILNYRLSSRRVRDIVERIYVDSWFSLSERLAYAKSKKSTLDRARVERGMIFCGENPFLWGRIVNNINIERDEMLHEKIMWEEIDRSDEFRKIDEWTRQS